MFWFWLKVETLIIPFRLIPFFHCFNLVQSPIGIAIVYVLAIALPFGDRGKMSLSLPLLFQI